MSYDIYFYKSKIGKPDIDEALEVTAEEYSDTETESGVSKEEIAKALIDYNPRLEGFDPDYEKIAALQNISIDEAKTQFDTIELNPPEGDWAIQIMISDNSAYLSIPYWYKGEEWEQVLDQSMEYQKIISRKAGYFVYDPQSGRTYDPLTIKTRGRDSIRKTTGEEAGEPSIKPWWKFW